MKLMFWKVAKAYNITDCNEAIKELEKVIPTIVVGFKGSNPKVFCRAFMKMLHSYSYVELYSQA